MNQYDIFISHASEDKAAVAEPLAHELTARGWRVWLDIGELTIGDSLEAKINDGLRGSRFGVVILSRDFFAKRWPERELHGFAAREVASGAKVILPVWHGVAQSDVLEYSPVLADKLGVSTERGIAVVAAEVEKALQAAAARPRSPARSSLVQGAVAPERQDMDLAAYWRQGGGMGLATVGVRRSDEKHHSEIWRVTSGSRVEHRWVPNDDGDWLWSPWRDFDCSFPARDVAAVSKQIDHAEVFVLASDGHVWHRWWTLDGNWSRFHAFGRPFRDVNDVRSIAAASRGDGQMDVVVEAFDGRVRSKWHWDGYWDQTGPHDGWHPLADD